MLDLTNFFVFLSVVALCITLAYCWSVYYRARVTYKDKDIKFSSEKMDEREIKQKEEAAKEAKEAFEEKLRWEKLDKEEKEVEKKNNNKKY